ncbi:MAG: hypothetical protein WKF89_10550 [Chitinophagaceae bacterium]
MAEKEKAVVTKMIVMLNNWRKENNAIMPFLDDKSVGSDSIKKHWLKY